MRKLLEKSLIIILCIYNLLVNYSSKYLVLLFLVSLILSISLDLVQKKEYKAILYVLFFIICLIDSTFISFMPLILYNFIIDFKITSIIYSILLIKDFSLLNLSISLLSIYISIRSYEYLELVNLNKNVRDNLREDALYLKKYNEKLKINEEKNIQIAVLTERNRIARELHDSIGHAISSSILQVEAIKVLSNNKNMEALNHLQNTLQNGMKDIREGIHNLYNESFDLEEKIKLLCKENQMFEIKLNYNIEDNMNYDLKYDIFTIVREGITNITKHSNAKLVNVSILNQVKFYSIIIEDNGTNFSKDINTLKKGIGIISMNEIATKYNGFLKYEFNDGFKIRVILMKGERI